MGDIQVQQPQVEDTEEREKQMLLREIVSLHFIGENPDFEEQVSEILEKYIVFLKNRPPMDDIREEHPSPLQRILKADPSLTEKITYEQFLQSHGLTDEEYQKILEQEGT